MNRSPGLGHGIDLARGYNLARLSRSALAITGTELRLMSGLEKTPVNIIDTDLSVDLAEATTPEDRVSVIATQSLTDNETWSTFQTGELIMFVDGRIHTRCVVPIPEEVQRQNRNHSSYL